MRRWLISIIAASVVCVPAFGQIAIDRKNQVANFGEGFCSWCCIETLGRHHGVKRLHHLAKNRSRESDFKTWDGEKWLVEPYVLVRHGDGRMLKEHRGDGTDWGIFRKLEALKVTFYCQPTGDASTKLIEYSMANKLGCVFGVYGNCFYLGSPPHALILTHFGAERIQYIDPNYPGRTFTRSRHWFDFWHMGWVLVVPPQ